MADTEDYEIPKDLIGETILIAYNELVQFDQSRPPDFMKFPGTLKEILKGSIRCEVAMPDGTSMDMTIPKSRLRYIGRMGKITAPSPGEKSRFSIKQ